MTNSPLFALPEAVDASVAWLFPGQGSQETGMGADLWRASPAARAVYDQVDSALGYELSQVCFNGPDERLNQTSFAQPALFSTSLAYLAAALESGRLRLWPGFMAGHSVGEYCALVATGALTLADGARLVQERARLMAAASEANPGTMAAILGLDEAAVAAICAETGADVCNRNLPTQTVVGGTTPAVARAVALAKERGGRAIELAVSGAFHSHLMQTAADALAGAIEATPLALPGLPVVANLTAAPVESVAGLRAELERQVVEPVRWHESVAFMAASGVSSFIEIGPGRVLTGLVRRLVPGAALLNLSSMAEIAAAESAVKTSA